MIYLNYEQAQEVFDRSDPVAKFLLAKVHSYMISDKLLTSSLRPVAPFDIRCLYHSIVFAAGVYLGRKFDTGIGELPRHEAANLPDLATPPWEDYDLVSNGMATLYINLLTETSSLGSPQFDVGFACRVVCEAIDREALDTANTRQRSTMPVDFDEWLEGFFADT